MLDGSMKTDTLLASVSSPHRVFDTWKMLSKYLPSKMNTLFTASVFFCEIEVDCPGRKWASEVGM